MKLICPKVEKMYYIDCEICSGIDKCSYYECVENVNDNVNFNKMMEINEPKRSLRKKNPVKRVIMPRIVKKVKKVKIIKRNPYEEDYKILIQSYLELAKTKLKYISKYIKEFDTINSDTVQLKH